jgi:hypothetical protein
MATLSQFKEDYFQSYINNVTKTPSNNINTVAQIPEDVPLETLIALTTYRPQVIQGTILQKNTQTSEAVQNATALRLQQSGLFTNNLRNFTPSISGRAIQRRRSADGRLIPLNPREALLSGLSPATRRLVQDLEDLRILRQIQDRLQQLTDRLEQQINKYTAIFNALINAPDALVSAGLTFLIDKLQQLEQFYNAAKAVLLLVRKVYENTRKAIIKALFKDIPRFARNVRRSIDVLRRILKLPEIPRRIKFPKFPKLPKFSFTAADFYVKYKLALNRLRLKSNLAYDKAYATAVAQSGYEIFDPNKDKIQDGLRRARNSLRQARAEFQAKQAIRTAAVERARNQLINNIRQTNTTVERERQNILKQYQNAKTARQQLQQQVGSRKAYLSATEASQLLRSSRVNIELKNIYGDLPTGTITPDGRTVYTDRTNNKVYVLQSARDRITELANKTTARVTANLNEVTTAANTFNNLFTSYGALAGGLNSNAIRTELVRNIVQEGNTVNQITRTAQQPTPGPVSLSSGTQQQEVSVNQQTKSISTVSRRLRPNDAIVEVERLNRQRAEQLGYSGVVSADATPPIPKEFNGQTIFEARLTISYASQSLEGRGAQIGLGQGVSSTVIGQRPVGSVGLSQLTTAPLTGNVVGQNVEVATGTPFIRTSATATLPTASRSPGARSPRATVPPPQIVPGGDIVAIPKLSVFEITALQNRLASPFISDEEKVRIREILGIGNEITSDLQLPTDTPLEFSQEATRPNLTVSVAGNRARLTYNAGRVANVEYSTDNGTTWTPVNPPARAGDILLDNLENGVYAARVRGVRADGTRTAPSQPKAIVVRASEPRILRTQAESATGVIIIFDDPVSSADISRYQFTTRSDNSLWIDALSATNEKRVVRSPILAYGLEENKTYTIRIRAVYLDGTFGPPSNTATFTTFKLFTQGGGVIS